MLDPADGHLLILHKCLAGEGLNQYKQYQKSKNAPHKKVAFEQSLNLLSHLDLRQDFTFARRRNRVYPHNHLPKHKSNLHSSTFKVPQVCRFRQDKVPLTGWNCAVQCEEDCRHTHTDEDVDHGGQGPGGCQVTRNEGF